MSFLLQEEQLSSLDEDFQTLQQLAQEIIPSVSEQETTKINSLLDELRTSLQILKQKTSRNQNVLDGETRNTKGLGKGMHLGETKGNEGLGEDVCCPVETGNGTPMRFSDDSDEEHRMLRGSSDGSQYGSDSGMGDSLMNTLASECTDGPSKMPIVSPVNNIAQKEMEVNEVSDSEDTICDENSPMNEHDIDRIFLASQHIPQSKPGSEFGRNNLKRTMHKLQDESDVPLDHTTNKTYLSSEKDTEDNSVTTPVNDAVIAEDDALLNIIAHNVPPAGHEGSTTIPRTNPLTFSKLMKLDQGSESDSQEYLSLPKANATKVTQAQISLGVDNLTNTDSRPFIPTEFLLPEQNQKDTGSALSEQTPSEIEPFEIPPSEQTSSGDFFENHSPQKTRDHDVDEELLLRSLASENVNSNEKVGEGQGVPNIPEYPLVSCVPPPMKTVEEFVEEPDALFQRLVDIEVMLRPQGKDEENLKSALLKHVVSII